MVASLLTSAPAAADQYDRAAELLERMAAAMRDLSYQGTFVYVRGEDVDTMRITHVRDGNGVRERMYAVSGPQREIVRDQWGVSYLLGDKPERQDPPASGSVFPEFPVDALKQAQSRYLFRVGARTARIAGHRSKSITILPRDRFRYGYELCLEERTGLLLRWVLYDADRLPLAKLMFTELVTGDRVDLSELESAAVGGDRLAFASVESNPPAPSAWRPVPAGVPESGANLSDFGELQGLPPGFRLAGHARDDGRAGTGFEHLVYSDGLATVSVYIEPSDTARPIAQGLSRMGTTNAWSLIADTFQVTAIGEVPPITVQRIGNAFGRGKSSVRGSGPE